MRLSVDRAQAAAAVKRASLVQYPSIPICTHAKLVAGDGKLTVTSSDLEVVYAEAVPADIEQEGAATAASSSLAHALMASRSDRAALRADGDFTSIVCGASKFKLASLPPDDFPIFAPADGQPRCFEVEAEKLARLLGLVDFCVARDRQRPYLEGVYFESRNGMLRLTATDGASLARMQTDIRYAGPGVIVPTKAVAYMRALAGKVSVSTDSRQLWAKTETVTIQSKLIDHTFPECDRVVPEKDVEPSAVDSKVLTAALDRLSPLGGDNGVVGVTARGSSITLSYVGSEASFVDTVPADVGQESAICFKGKRLGHAISAAGETALLYLPKNPGFPVRIGSPTNEDWAAVVMPWRDHVQIADIAA